MFDTDRLNISVAITDGNYPNNFMEALINGIIDRILDDVILGSGVPDPSAGEDGDTYLDLAALAFYTKSSGSWGSSTALDNNANTLKLIID